MVPHFETYKDTNSVAHYPVATWWDQDTYAAAAEDNRTIWQNDEPKILPADITGIVSENYFSEQGIDTNTMGVCLVGPHAEPLTETRTPFDTVLEIHYLPDEARLLPLPPPIIPESTDARLQISNGAQLEEPSVRYMYAHIPPGDATDRSSVISSELFDKLWRMYEPAFEGLSSRFPIRGTDERTHLQDLMSNPDSFSFFTGSADQPTAFAVVCKLEDYTEYIATHMNVIFPEPRKLYCPVIVSSDATSISAVLSISKLTGQTVRNPNEPTLIFVDCPTMTYRGVTKILEATRANHQQKVRVTEYAKTVFRLILTH